MLPAEIIAQLREEFSGQGADPTILEVPFSGPRFRRVLEEAEARLRRLVDIASDYAVLFLQGGATAQFAAVPLNLLGAAGRADYVHTGYWSRRAIDEACRYGSIRIAASMSAGDPPAIAPRDTWRLDPHAAYVHITSNETADGIEFDAAPDVGRVALVSDMTASFLTQPVDVGRYGLIYASAQKNLGAAGLTIVIVRRDLLARAHPHTPAVLHYGLQAQAGSRLNTPPMFSVYVANLMLGWLEREGGLAQMDQRARARAAQLYAAIDGCETVYRCAAPRAQRSRISVCFRLHDERLMPLFLEQATAAGLLNLAGHGRIGGLRACLYNAMPLAGAQALAHWLRGFARRHG